MSKRDCSVSTSSDPFGGFAAPEYGGRRRHRRQRRRRHGPRTLWLVLAAVLALPLVIPALALAARTVVLVLRAVLVALVAVAEGLFVGLGWLLALLLLVALPGLVKTFQARRRLEQAAAQPAAAPTPVPVPDASPLARLALQTRDTLDAQRAQLPAAVHAQLDSMRAQLTALAAQLAEGQEQPALASELQGLLGDELPQLIQAYLKVPVALRQRALQGGMSPEAQLVAGLGTLDEQLSVFHERLAARDLQALAVHQRYLDLKYKR
jgi:hypothetical protein